MITIIFGDPGDGKTALMTMIAMSKMIEEGYDYWWQSARRIDLLKAGGFFNLEYLPQRHTVYSDYEIKSKYPKVESYYTDGYKIALPNPFFETMFFAPYSQIFLDEAQKYYDSRMSKFLRDCVYRFYQLHRQNHLDIYMTCQRLSNIDINIRQIAGRYILCKGCKVEKDSYDRIIKMEIKYFEFSNMGDAEKYYTEGKCSEKVKEKIFRYDSDIFQNYNSYANEPAFYAGNYYKSYDCYTEEGYVDTVESYMAFNHNHMYYAPVGYFKNEKRDAEMLKQQKLISKMKLSSIIMMLFYLIMNRKLLLKILLIQNLLIQNLLIQNNHKLK